MKIFESLRDVRLIADFVPLKRYFALAISFLIPKLIADKLGLIEYSTDYVLTTYSLYTVPNRDIVRLELTAQIIVLLILIYSTAGCSL